MNKSSRRTQSRKREAGVFLWKTITIPNLRFNTEKIKKFYKLEHKHKDMLTPFKGNTANFIQLPLKHNGESVISKEVYMPFVNRHPDAFLKVDKYYNQGIHELGGVVVNDKNLKATILRKKQKLKEKQNARYQKN